MRNALLVAIREYAENARTKGFWIGILLVPVMLVGAVVVMRWLAEDATPTRHYVVVDQSDGYGEAIQRRMDLRYAAVVLQSFQVWLANNQVGAEEEKQQVDFESMPPISLTDFDADVFIDQLIEANPEKLEKLLEPGGFEAMVEQAKPQLKPDASEFEMPRRFFKQIELPADVNANEDEEAVAEALKPYLKGEKRIDYEGEQVTLFAAMIIPKEVDAHFDPKEEAPRDGISGAIGAISDGMAAVTGANAAPPVQYWSSNLADDDLHDRLRDSMNRELRRSQYVKRGIDVGLVAAVQRMNFEVKKLDPDKEVGKEEVSQADKLREIAPIGFVYILWISIMQVASMLLNNTIEEKSNRIIEVLLSSVTAWELMAGKLLGIAGIGLTMLLTWIASAAVMLWYWASPEAEMITNLASVIFDSTLLPAFVFYFLLGYFMYASIFLAIGSICNTIKEAQNFMGPVMMIMIVPILTMAFIPKDPHGTLATVLSWIPFYTPFVMMNRAAADPPAFDLYGTAIMLVVANIAMLWLCGRIFRTGILRTGQPPRLKELLSWVRRSAD